eukprot:TRINITY_DN12066_c0_g1_i3.p1 TRINITY_DN12066_c0_g1~~TRINITY_DN12066_c0_g1_i3.p1  ORF type:complete len:371 (-),score=55.28 TRINITY_DN12066_c0_g1_i3:491-1555(-)
MPTNEVMTTNEVWTGPVIATVVGYDMPTNEVKTAPVVEATAGVGASEKVSDLGKHNGVMMERGLRGFAPKTYATLSLMLISSSMWMLITAVEFNDYSDGQRWLAEHDFILAIAVIVLFFLYMLHLFAVVCGIEPIRSGYVRLMQRPPVNYLIAFVAASAFGIIFTRISYAHELARAFGFMPPIAAVIVVAQFGSLLLMDDLQTVLVPLVTVILGLSLSIAVGIFTVYEDYTEYGEHCHWSRWETFWKYLPEYKHLPSCERAIEPDASNIPFKICLAFVECALVSIGFGAGCSLRLISVFRVDGKTTGCCSSSIDYTVGMSAMMALELFYEIFNSGFGFALQVLSKLQTPKNRHR